MQQSLRVQGGRIGKWGAAVAAGLLSAALPLAGWAQAPFTGKPVYRIEARRAGSVLGTIYLELFPTIAPRHVWNWDSLVAEHFFDTTAFHRVVPGFVIQGGDPNSRHGPRSTWGYGQPSQPNVPAEFSAVSHERGILSAARDANINSANSQFFICVAAARSLNGQYSAYGRVRGGIAVADQIVSAPRDGNDNPLQKIEMFVTRIGSNDTLAVVPQRLAPANGAGGEPEQPVLRWRAHPTTMLYSVQVSPDSTFATNLLVDVTLSQRDSTLTVPALPAATTCYWRIRANNGGSVSAWGLPWRFRTGVAAPVLLAPANGVVTGIPTAPLLQWAPVPGATSYAVQVARSAQFRSNQIIYDAANLPGAQWQVPPAGLPAGQRVYWRARAVLGTEAGYFAAAWNFVPTVVTGVAPLAEAGFGLAPVAPHPVVSTAGAALPFGLTQAGAVQLSIYDALGRVVAQPVAGTWLPAGAHTATVPPGTLAPGLYVVRLTAGGRHATQRLVVVGP